MLHVSWEAVMYSLSSLVSIVTPYRRKTGAGERCRVNCNAICSACSHGQLHLFLHAVGQLLDLVGFAHYFQVQRVFTRLVDFGL